MFLFFFLPLRIASSEDNFSPWNGAKIGIPLARHDPIYISTTERNKLSCRGLSYLRSGPHVLKLHEYFTNASIFPSRCRQMTLPRKMVSPCREFSVSNERKVVGYNLGGQWGDLTCVVEFSHFVKRAKKPATLVDRSLLYYLADFAWPTPVDVFTLRAFKRLVFF